MEVVAVVTGRKVMKFGRGCFAACLEEGTIVFRDGRFESSGPINGTIYAMEIEEPCPNCGEHTPVDA